MYEMSGGGSNPRVSRIKLQDTVNSEIKYLVHIYISSADNKVNSDVNEIIPNLQQLDFSAIIALKDLRGDVNGRSKIEADLPSVEAGDRYAFANSPIPITSIIAVMEIETWFIGETNHYTNYDARLTKNLIQANKCIINVDPYVDRLEGIAEPAETLDRIYQLVRRHYSKKERVRRKTIQAIDWNNLYFMLPRRITKLHDFVTAIDNFFV